MEIHTNWQAVVARTVEEAHSLAHSLHDSPANEDQREGLHRAALLIQIEARRQRLPEMEDLAHVIEGAVESGAVTLPRVSELESALDRMRVIARGLMPVLC